MAYTTHQLARDLLVGPDVPFRLEVGGDGAVHEGELTYIAVERAPGDTAAKASEVERVVFTSEQTQPLEEIAQLHRSLP